MATAVLCGKGGVFFSPAGGGAVFSVFPVPGAAVFPVPGAAVFPVSADNGPFVCAERAFLLSGEDRFWKGARV